MAFQIWRPHNHSQLVMTVSLTKYKVDLLHENMVKKNIIIIIIIHLNYV